MPNVSMAFLVTFRGLAMAGKSKLKLSTKIQISTEVQNVNFWLSARYCQTLVGRCACSVNCFSFVKFINIFDFSTVFCSFFHLLKLHFSKFFRCAKFRTYFIPQFFVRQDFVQQFLSESSRGCWKSCQKWSLKISLSQRFENFSQHFFQSDRKWIQTLCAKIFWSGFNFL